MHRFRTGGGPPEIIFSDLDGTLLNHEDYRFDAALPALRAVKARNIPLILTTSKTLAETAVINDRLGNRQVVIVENGCALAFPLDLDYPFDLAVHEMLDGYGIIRLAPPYRLVRDFIDRQRDRHGWRLRGFGDMDTSELSGLTGLDKISAEHAGRRLCDEPFMWQDNADALEQFVAAAEHEGLAVTHGGRFHHLMGRTDKANAMHALRSLFSAKSSYPALVIALGDSENDRGMLEAADIAVVIQRHDGTHLDCYGIKQTLFTKESGPVGWNAAVLQILDEFSAHHPPS